MILSYNHILKEIKGILNTDRDIKEFKYSSILHNPKENINLEIFESFEIKGDFNNNAMDQAIINYNISSGVVTYDILPYKNNLELTLLISRNGVRYSTETFKVVLGDSISNFKGPNANIKKEDLDKGDMQLVSFHLLEKNLEVARILKVDGIYRNINMEDLLYVNIYNTINQVELNGVKMDTMVNIVKPDNSKKYNNVIIPTGTRLIDLPSFLQDDKYGIYNGDIGTYIQNIRINQNEHKMCFFVYPLYTKEEDSYDELIVLQSDDKVNKVSDNSYIKVGKQLKILASDFTMLEEGEGKHINKGASITSSNPDNIINYNSKGDSKLYFKKNAQLHNETLQTEDTLVNEKYVGNTPNLFKHKSALFNDSLDIVKIQWIYSDHKLLHPGMKASIFYQDDNSVKKIRGVLQSFYSVYNEVSKSEVTILIIKGGYVYG